SPCLDFGNVIVGHATASQTVTLKNGGPTTLKVNSITVTGLSGHDFSQTNNCTNVAPNGSCTITVTFTPLAENPRYATIMISDSALTQQSIFIIGTGTPPDSLTPSSLTFPDTQVGQTSASQPVTLKNLDTVNPLSVTNVSITGTNLQDFSQ